MNASTPEQPNATLPATPGDRSEQYDANGVDLSLIRANLRLSPTERARRAERARRSALRVQEIGRAARRQST